MWRAWVSCEVDEWVLSQLVRALVRKPEAAAKLPAGVEAALGDLLDPPAVKRALAGVDKLYLLNAVVPDELTQGLIAVDLARKAGVKGVVYHSVFRAERFPEVPHFAPKVAIEAAIALTTKGHEGVTYNLNGPDLISGPAAAVLCSEALGKPVKYPGEDMDGFEAQLRQRAPSWSAFDIRMMFQGYLEKGFQAEPGDVETLTRLLGHPPRRYANFVAETAKAWAKS